MTNYNHYVTLNWFQGLMQYRALIMLDAETPEVSAQHVITS
ncbi:hypothetical protein JM83_0739 [Gillisia sp. Hel_I_86]|nr:hypothetical protein JM83_0739 [Gillisia sp. Hel_I_86]